MPYKHHKKSSIVNTMFSSVLLTLEIRDNYGYFKDKKEAALKSSMGLQIK